MRTPADHVPESCRQAGSPGQILGRQRRRGGRRWGVGGQSMDESRDLAAAAPVRRADRIRLPGRFRSSCGENTCSSRVFDCLALGADGGLATTDCQLGIDGMELFSSLTLFWSPEGGFSHP